MTAVSAPQRAPWLRFAAYVARRKRFAPLAWGLPLGLMAVMVVAVFPSIEASSQLDELIKSYPDALKEAFGISDASFPASRATSPPRSSARSRRSRSPRS